MNAAARLVHQNVITRHLLLTHEFSYWRLAILTMVLGILVSALSIIYVTNETRIENALYQNSLKEETHLNIKKSQLLLEMSAVLLKVRTQQMEVAKLGMQLPDHPSMVIIKE